MNLQLDHFSERQNFSNHPLTSTPREEWETLCDPTALTQKTTKKRSQVTRGARKRVVRTSTAPPQTGRKGSKGLLGGIQNVSRWMTWLPISVKNAAKCDKWYVLQNHPITESLNAKGAREKLFASDPRACRMLSVEKTKNTTGSAPRTKEEKPSGLVFF